MTTKMVPSSNYSEDYDTSSSSQQRRQEEEEEGQHGSVNEDSTRDYELYNYPENVTPQYRSIPFLVEGIVLAISYALPMALRRSKMMIFSNNNHSKKSQAKMVCWWLAQLALSWWTCRTIVQDALYSPSRIAQPWKHLKPCSLSRHSTISTATLPSFASKLKQPQKSQQDAMIPLDPLGVHYIQYDNDNNKDDIDDDSSSSNNNNNNNNNVVWFDAVHCNHGFGASSLSWLPALPSLTKIAKAPFGLAHDCVGFGLTERPLPTAHQLTRNPNLLLPYTSLGTASIGNQLLLQQAQQAPKNKNKPLESIVLFGHSMGTVATLQMALHFLPRETKKLIILVAPALITSSKQQQSKQLQSNATSTKIQKLLSYIIQSQPTQTLKLIVQLFYYFLRSVIFDAPLSYALKRIGSNNKFWKNALSVAWGDKSLLKSSDILRFEWPSVCQNWIPGILNFARSRLFYQTNQDLILLQQVVELPHTQVVIVHGTKDAVIPLSLSQTIVQHIKSQQKQQQKSTTKQQPQQSPIDLVLLEGRGHDPFEENVDEFSQCFQTIVHKFQQTYMNNNNNMSSNQSSE
jgi:pimeloyl-ACP methyl ester carboxylesterase